MKVVGIVGGLGPESTIEYYKIITKKVNNRTNGSHFPKVIIYSADVKEMIPYLRKNDFDGLTSFTLRCIEKLYAAGAEFVAIASNTPHIIIDRLQEKSPLPIINIVEETLNDVKKTSINKVGLIGTKSTMSADFFKKPFAENNIYVVVPNDKDKMFIHEKITQELEDGIISEKTKLEFIDIINKLKIEHGIQGVILGCTELPLLIREEDTDIKLFSTTSIHIENIIDRILK